MEAIAWTGQGLRLLDQTALPAQERYLEARDHRTVAEAIRSLRVRGASLIGIAAAYGLVLAARSLQGRDMAGFLVGLEGAAAELAATRPTAVNLSWALERLLGRARACTSPQQAVAALEEEARSLHLEQMEADRRLAELGASLLPMGAVVLTHCNTGALATGGLGTALGIVRVAWQTGRLSRVYATETRPLLQGARLTAWELWREGIPCTLIVDGAAGALMARCRLDAVVVGADRIAANGDVANKVGTYALALLARAHGVPFYVAAPTSTLDPSTPDGSRIPIEERSPEEVRRVGGASLAPEGVDVLNWAFDVTPAAYVDAIVTERGIARPPYGESLPQLLGGGNEHG
ncbi:MAG TPA: S-methyl-5-thioribose-1-phosphate isomerase [Dehalococcoidia bacterium]|nr:S-methyl-5-thioribose-1-phosphate isomerase [Dehalococcoidia bacterium]